MGIVCQKYRDSHAISNKLIIDVIAIEQIQARKWTFTCRKSSTYTCSIKIDNISSKSTAQQAINYSEWEEKSFGKFTHLEILIN